MPIPIPSPSATPDARAEQLFASARAALVARQYPHQLAYDVVVRGLDGTTFTTRTYKTYERWPSGILHASTISEEENANPFRPKGTNVSLPFFSDVSGKGDKIKDVIGTPRLSVTYQFGLAPPPAAVPLPSDVATPAPGAPREIGSVTAVKRNYDVRIAGEEMVNGIACTHLTLKPLGNPGTYRVRDLYVAVANDQIVRLRTDGNFTAKATGSGLWTVDYAQIDGMWYLASETSDGAVDGGDDGRFDRVDIRFENVHADPRENLDFGLAGSDDVPVLMEPSP